MINTISVSFQSIKNIITNSAMVLMLSFTKPTTDWTNVSPMVSKSLVRRESVTPIGVLSK